MRRLLLGFTLMVLTGCASNAELAATALALTPEHFRDTATIRDDSLDTVATITTEPGFKTPAGLLQIVWNDNFVRAFVDKRTGVARYQLYQRISYTGSWRFYERVNFETPTGPEAMALTVLSRDVLSCAGSAYSGCTYSEHMIFAVEEGLLRQIAAAFRPGEPMGWRFKFGARDGTEWQDGMLGAEISGALQAVERYRQTHGLPAST